MIFFFLESSTTANNSLCGGNKTNAFQDLHQQLAFSAMLKINSLKEQE